MKNLSVTPEGEYREVLNERLTLSMRQGAPVTTVDALLLAAFLPEHCGAACELGAGSGVIALLAAARGKLSSALLIEREEALYDLCRRNVRDNRLEDMLTVRCADLRELDDGGIFDTVFANPPYRRANDGMPAANRLADVARYERYGTIEDFCRVGARMLSQGGRFCAVFPIRRRSELLRAIAEAGLSPEHEVTVYPYPGGTSKLMLLSARKSACEHRRESFTLCREAGGEPTEAALRLYREGILITEGETV